MTATKDIQQAFKERLDYDELMNCMRCGFCLPSCPTYGQTKIFCFGYFPLRYCSLFIQAFEKQKACTV
ncbi:hypothetical protein G3M54_26305 [Bacillus megaterium NBRC 15308 = ATCC 14581]|nr:hypothetical protein [Priestia megaterium NBRC 15308 = ATCC 14581]